MRGGREKLAKWGNSFLLECVVEFEDKEDNSADEVSRSWESEQLELRARRTLSLYCLSASLMIFVNSWGLRLAEGTP